MHAHPSKSSRAHLSPSSCVHLCVRECVLKSFDPSGSQPWKSEASARTDFSGGVAQLWAIYYSTSNCLPSLILSYLSLLSSQTTQQWLLASFLTFQTKWVTLKSPLIFLQLKSPQGKMPVNTSTSRLRREGQVTRRAPK